MKMAVVQNRTLKHANLQPGHHDPISTQFLGLKPFLSPFTTSQQFLKHWTQIVILTYDGQTGNWQGQTPRARSAHSTREWQPHLNTLIKGSCVTSIWRIDIPIVVLYSEYNMKRDGKLVWQFVAELYPYRSYWITGMWM